MLVTVQGATQLWAPTAHLCSSRLSVLLALCFAVSASVMYMHYVNGQIAHGATMIASSVALNGSTSRGPRPSNRPAQPWVPDLQHQPSYGDLVVILATTPGRDVDFSWLSEQPYDYVIMTKAQPAGTPNNLPENRGYDAPSYMQFIVEHYDHLPERMVFAHGHRAGWHYPVRQVALLTSMSAAGHPSLRPVLCRILTSSCDRWTRLRTTTLASA